ncbi:hypothetical protein FQZ97_1039990 [compost metagenome]
MVVITKATAGQPPQRIQRGMPHPRPWRLTASLSAPSGQNTPHQTRPSKTMLSSTKGHQMPQNRNCANRPRWSRMRAASSGSGRNAGSTTSTA